MSGNSRSGHLGLIRQTRTGDISLFNVAVTMVRKTEECSRLQGDVETWRRVTWDHRLHVLLSRISSDNWQNSNRPLADADAGILCTLYSCNFSMFEIKSKFKKKQFRV